MSRIINLGKLDTNLKPDTKLQLQNVILSRTKSRNITTEINSINFQPKKKSKWKLIAILTLIVFSLCSFIAITIFGFNFQSFRDKLSIFESSTCTGKICNEFENIKLDNSVCVGVFCSNGKFNLPKTNNRTNILITGIDTREKGSSTFLTDTIMVLSYDHKTGFVYMISFPRDIVVTYENYYGELVKSKINELYYSGGAIEDHHEEGVLTLQKELEKITGLTIHYNAMITLKGFVDLIDKLGGVDITLTEDVSDVYPISELTEVYKKSKCVATVFVEDGQYCQWVLKAGKNHLDGQSALVYARSRKYSSDWVRAARQQEVISAVRAKITSSSTLSNPQKLFDIVATLKDNIKTSKYGVNDLLAALDLKDSIKNIVQLVLDPTFGNGELIGSGPVGTGLGSHQIILDSTYKKIKEYLALISTNPEIFVDKPNIFVYSDIGLDKINRNYYAELADERKFPGAIVSYIPVVDSYDTFNIPSPTGSVTTSVATSKNLSASSNQIFKYKIYLIDYSKGLKSISINKIKQLYPEIEILTTNSSKALNSEDFAIVIAED